MSSLQGYLSQMICSVKITIPVIFRMLLIWGSWSLPRSQLLFWFHKQANVIFLITRIGTRVEILLPWECLCSRTTCLRRRESHSGSDMGCTSLTFSVSSGYLPLEDGGKAGESYLSNANLSSRTLVNWFAKKVSLSLQACFQNQCRWPVKCIVVQTQTVVRGLYSGVKS